MRYKYQCSGIRHCQYLTEELMTLNHKHVEEATWTQMQSLREAIDLTEPNKKRRDTNRLETYLQMVFH